MIKLKIGDNYLITTNKDMMMKNFIIYTMSCFKGHNKLLLGFDPISRDVAYMDYLKALREEKPKEIFILIDNSLIAFNSIRTLTTETLNEAYKTNLKAFITQLQQSLPNIKIAVVKVQNKKDSREFKLGRKIYETLELDNKSIIKYLDKLDEYKFFANRYKAIPGELRVVNESIKNIDKDKKVNERIITLEDLSYLNLLDSINLNGTDLIATIKPLPIYPSKPLGLSFTKSSFEGNKYLAKAAEYLYKGGHFGMVGTKIAIHPNFTPEFIDTIKHDFDDMFAYNNWSNIGYLHFGKGHLCGGEFNDVIAHTSEYGLEYYFISLKQYITTANMDDYAGKKVWWYPIYDDNNNLVYCAGLDMLREYILPSLPLEEKGRVEKMSWEDFLRFKIEHPNITFSNFHKPACADNISSYTGKEDAFLEYCKEHRPELYEELKKGAK